MAQNTKGLKGQGHMSRSSVKVTDCGIKPASAVAE